MDLALNNLQGLICHKTEKTNQLEKVSLFLPVFLLRMTTRRETTEIFTW